MASTDLMVPSPSERASVVHTKLQTIFGDDLTNWDLICFSIEYLASQLPVFPWLDEGALRRLAKLIYTAHYLSETQLVPSGVRNGERTLSNEGVNTGRFDSTENHSNTPREEPTTTHKLIFRPRTDTQQQGTAPQRSLFAPKTRLFNK